MELGMNRLGKQLSVGTQQLAAQAVIAAQAAGASIVAGLKTCDEKSGGSLSQFELRIDPDHHSQRGGTTASNYHKKKDSITAASCFNQLHSYHNERRDENGLISTLLEAVSIPSTALAVPLADGSRPVNRLSSSTGPSSTANTWGTPSFEFNLDLVSHGPSAGCLVASARRVFRGGPGGLSGSSSSVPIRCRWRRKIAGQVFDIPNASGTEYPITADDVASQIVVEASALDSHDKDLAYAECGPFELDASFRKHLDDYLAVGNTRFPVRLRTVASSEGSPGRSSNSRGNKTPSWLSGTARKSNEPVDAVCEEEEELVLHVSGDAVKVVKPGPKNVGYVKEWSCGFGADYPRVTLSYTDLTEFELQLSSSDRLSLVATTRSQRDLLTLSIRCFHARQWTANSLLLQHAAVAAGRLATQTSKDSQGTVPPGPSPELLAIDVFAVVQRLNAELYRSLEHQEKSSRERDRAQIEKDALEEEIAATIGAYQQLLAQGTSSLNGSSLPADTARGSSTIPAAGNPDSSKTIALEITQRAAHIAELESRLKESNQEAQKYRAELDRLRRSYRDLQATIGREPAPVQTNVAVPRPSDALGPRYEEGVTRIHSLGSAHSHNEGEKKCELSAAQELETAKALLRLQQQHAELRQQYDAKKAEVTALETRCRVLDRQLGVPSQAHQPSGANPVSAACSKCGDALRKKESLEKQLESWKSDNKQLAENILYIKSKYDALVATSAKHSADQIQHSGTLKEEMNAVQQKLREAEGELERVRRELSAVSTERNRYAKKIEVLSKDLEKTQSLFESKTATLTALNKQISLEKESCEEALQKALNAALTKSAASAEAAQRSEEQLRDTEKKLAEKIVELEKLEKTNETLRSRIRKLATDTPSEKPSSS